MSPEEAAGGELLWRLQSLEKTVQRLEDDQKRFMAEVQSGWKSFADRVDKRFAEQTDLLGKLAYVPRGEYTIEHRNLQEKVEAADRHAWWAIAMIATSVMGAIITATLARAF